MIENKGNTLSEEIGKRLEKGRAILLGLGISNRPLAEYLLLHGMGGRVVIRDGKDAASLGKTLADLVERGCTAAVGCDPAIGLCDREDMSDTVIFRSPGIRPDSGDLPEAVRRGALLTSEMEWFVSATPAKIIAVTGSDGKTTTTTLTHLLLSRAAKEGKIYVGGNIGTPLLDRVGDMTEKDIAVLELSSFQLQTMNGPAVRAAVTNISPNHLNWHTDMEEYTEAKYRVFGTKTEQIAVNAKNALSRAAADRFSGRVIFFTAHNTPDDSFETLTGGRPDSAAIFLHGDDIVYSDGENEEVVLDRKQIILPGIHNVENYMTAIALTWGLVPKEAIRQVAGSFGGVQHRFEFVRRLDGVKYYNSSIDSSPSRTAAALSNLDCRPVVICGGRDKHVPFDPLAEALFEKASAVVLTGEAASQIDAAIQKAAADRPDGGASLTVCRVDDFDEAIAKARELAKSGSAVILSPACTSFDRFANFEERGERFKKIVRGFRPDLKKLIFELSSLMSVTGHTSHDADRLTEIIGGYFDEVTKSPVGNYTFVKRCGRDHAPKILVDAHLDEIGMVVTSIRDGGFLTVDEIGGVDTRILPASDVVIYGKDCDGKAHPIFGVVGSTPPHLQKPGDSGKLKEIGELLIDTGYSKAELEKFVRIGTPVGFAPAYLELANDRIAGKGFDDKSCGACAVAAIADTDRDELWGDVYFQFSNFEEDGTYFGGAQTGAYAIDPDCALVADVSLAFTPDTQRSETSVVGGGVTLTYSPLTDKKLTRVLAAEAGKAEIKTQPTIAVRDTGTNATVVGLVRNGIPTVDVGLPLKSMHTCSEVIAMEDAEALRRLIRLFITSKAVAGEICNE